MADILTKGLRKDMFLTIENCSVVPEYYILFTFYISFTFSADSRGSVMISTSCYKLAFALAKKPKHA